MKFFTSPWLKWLSESPTAKSHPHPFLSQTNRNPRHETPLSTPLPLRAHIEMASFSLHTQKCKMFTLRLDFLQLLQLLLAPLASFSSFAAAFGSVGFALGLLWIPLAFFPLAVLLFCFCCCFWSPAQSFVRNESFDALQQAGHKDCLINLVQAVKSC